MHSNFDSSIIDQHARGLADRLKSELEQVLGLELHETRARSIAFVVLCMKLLFDLSDEEAIDYLTESGTDFGVDAVMVRDVGNNELMVALFQGAYHHGDLGGETSFPRTGVEKAIRTARLLFAPQLPLSLPPRLEAKLVEVRSRARSGALPRVRFLLCSNGQRWEPGTQQLLDEDSLTRRVAFDHINHVSLVRKLESSPPIIDVLQFAGKSFVEEADDVRAFFGKVPVTELARLMEAHGDRLLERNIRRFLGFSGIWVNKQIRETLESSEQRKKFHFYNNGLTLICSRFDYYPSQPESHKVRVEGLQIINGAQTSQAIWTTLMNARQSSMISNWDGAYVKVQLYEVRPDSSRAEELARMMTHTTNSQTPVELVDLHSNTEIQKRLELSVAALGYRYHRQRSAASLGPKDIVVVNAAVATLSVWREAPAQAQEQISAHFDELYTKIFREDLNGAQVVVAMLLMRIAERKCAGAGAGAPALVHYGAGFAAMLMGRRLLADLGCELAGLDHRNFPAAQGLLETRKDQYFEEAVAKLQAALRTIYGISPISSSRLASIFRNENLLGYL